MNARKAVTAGLITATLSASLMALAITGCTTVSTAPGTAQEYPNIETQDSSSLFDITVPIWSNRSQDVTISMKQGAFAQNLKPEQFTLADGIQTWSVTQVQRTSDTTAVVHIEHPQDVIASASEATINVSPEATTNVDPATEATEYSITISMMHPQLELDSAHTQALFKEQAPSASGFKLALYPVDTTIASTVSVQDVTLTNEKNAQLKAVERTDEGTLVLTIDPQGTNPSELGDLRFTLKGSANQSGGDVSYTYSILPAALSVTSRSYNAETQTVSLNLSEQRLSLDMSTDNVEVSRSDGEAINDLSVVNGGSTITFQAPNLTESTLIQIKPKAEVTASLMGNDVMPATVKGSELLSLNNSKNPLVSIGTNLVMNLVKKGVNKVLPDPFSNAVNDGISMLWSKTISPLLFGKTPDPMLKRLDEIEKTIKTENAAMVQKMEVGFTSISNQIQGDQFRSGNEKINLAVSDIKNKVASIKDLVRSALGADFVPDEGFIDQGAYQYLLNNKKENASVLLNGYIDSLLSDLTTISYQLKDQYDGKGNYLNQYKAYLLQKSNFTIEVIPPLVTLESEIVNSTLDALVYIGMGDTNTTDRMALARQYGDAILEQVKAANTQNINGKDMSLDKLVRAATPEEIAQGYDEYVLYSHVLNSWVAKKNLNSGDYIMNTYWNPTPSERTYHVGLPADMRDYEHMKKVIYKAWGHPAGGTRFVAAKSPLGYHFISLTHHTPLFGANYFNVEGDRAHFSAPFDGLKGMVNKDELYRLINNAGTRPLASEFEALDWKHADTVITKVGDLQEQHGKRYPYGHYNYTGEITTIDTMATSVQTSNVLATTNTDFIFGVQRSPSSFTGKQQSVLIKLPS